MLDSPQRARVRPRVVLPGFSEAIAVDALVGELPREAGEVLGIIGESGSGRTTALEHLAALTRPAAGAPVWLDDADTEDVRHAMMFGPVVYAAMRPVDLSGGGQRVWRLAPWSRDDLIEYALAGEAGRARSVLARALAMYERDPLDGLAAAWAVVLDVLAEDDGAADLRAVIESALRPSDEETRERLSRLCLESVLGHGATDVNRPLPTAARRLLRCGRVREMVAVGFLSKVLRGGEAYQWLRQRWPRELVALCGAALADEARRFLREVLRGSYAEAQAMAASVLHAAGEGIPRGAVPRLDGAYLDGLRAAGATLEKLRAGRAALLRADFRGAILRSASFHGADLAGACLSEAVLVGAGFGHAVLTGARLTGADATGATFRNARLGGADLEGVIGHRAIFSRATLMGARLVRGDFEDAEFSRCDLREADASAATFDWAHLQDLDLRETVLAGATFRHARLERCDLSGQTLQAPDLARALLEDTDLTGSVMPNANFEGAAFPGAGLAEVHWERANLRDADLRGCTFHMGSSRSGLVFSPIACEGSRTGFYTEDLEDFTHKTPEEVRKANLRGADLRGCVLEGVDFYLVDLREARYDTEAEKWFRKCGAILEEWRR